MRRTAILLAAALIGAGGPAGAASPSSADLATLSAIRSEGLEGSRVMDHLSWLGDVYGPRTSGSPALAAASDWAMKRMAGWGLTDVHQERFRFGAGWALEKSAIRMTAPEPMQ